MPALRGGEVWCLLGLSLHVVRSVHSWDQLDWLWYCSSHSPSKYDDHQHGSGCGSSSARRRLMCTTKLDYYSQCRNILTSSRLVSRWGCHLSLISIVTDPKVMQQLSIFAILAQPHWTRRPCGMPVLTMMKCHSKLTLISDTHLPPATRVFGKSTSGECLWRVY